MIILVFLLTFSIIFNLYLFYVLKNGQENIKILNIFSIFNIVSSIILFYICFAIKYNSLNKHVLILLSFLLLLLNILNTKYIFDKNKKTLYITNSLSFVVLLCLCLYLIFPIIIKEESIKKLYLNKDEEILERLMKYEKY